MPNYVFKKLGRISALTVVLLVLVATATGFGLGWISKEKLGQTGALTTSTGNQHSTVQSKTSISTTTAFSNTSTMETTKVKPTTYTAVKSVKSYEDLMRIASSSSQAENMAGIPLYGTYMSPRTVTAATAKEGSTTGGEIPEHSETNVQVSGVDEADIVKNDGKYLYVIGRSSWSEELKRPFTSVYIIVGYPPKDLKVASKLKVEGYAKGLFINGNMLIIINTSYIKTVKYAVVKSGENATLKPEGISRYVPMTSLLVYNVSNRRKPVLKDRISVSGWYFSARMINSTVYVLTTYGVSPVFEGGVIKIVSYPEVNGIPIPPQNIHYVSSPYIIPWSRTYVNVLGFDLKSNSYNVSSFILPPPNRIYVSKNSIYLLSARWGYMDIIERILRDAVLPELSSNFSQKMLRALDNQTLPLSLRIYRAEEILSSYIRSAGVNESIKVLSAMYTYMEKKLVYMPLQTTDVFKLKLLGLKAVMVGHGTVKGRVLDQFAMSEKGNYFMVATTSSAIKGLRLAGGWGWSPTIVPEFTYVSCFYILNSSSLKSVGNLTGLAKGERVYAARYVGNYLYLVTFRRVDPLFAINISNPKKPEVVGFVKMPGYSEYLHPYKNKFLIGVGYSADLEGRVRGIKVSVYNVSNPKDIRIVSEVNLTKEWSYTQVAWDHKAFLINPSKGYLAIPVITYVSGKGSQGFLYVISINSKGELILKGRIEHQGVIRAVYIGDYIYTISVKEVKAIYLSTLKVISALKLE